MADKNPDKLITAQRVTELLEETKMSQTRYAKMLHLSQPAISGKLSGAVKFTANDIWRTAMIFGVSTDYLYGLTDRKDAVMAPV
ncbi:helix-turn-helix domain-containing protein [Bifidobacterium ruminantium]|uniref:helix-turn-helix domain-containing protein n=1 Tax=Bifidobacterium ruminantium TaxID=78346 RepID=UPI0024939DB3|nr:helix-turn-helix transcriptional regulator [Bifidobacterium ruminantium]